VHHLLAQLHRSGAADGTAQHLAVFRVPGQMIGQARADAEHRGQPVTEILLAAQRGAQGVRVIRGVEDPRQTDQRQIGVGHGGQSRHQRVGPQLGLGDTEIGKQKTFGPRRIGETHPRQPPCQRGSRTTHLSKLNLSPAMQ